MPGNPLGHALRHRRVGPEALAWARSDLQAPGNFTLTSPAFDDANPIPEQYRGRLRGPNISPALTWTPPPDTAAELVLIVQDADSPFGKPNTHALSIGIGPSLGGLPEGGLADPSPVPGLRSGKGALGRRGWAGPMPIRSHGPHRYVFQLFAVDHKLDLPGKFSLDEALDTMTGHLVGRAQLVGTYEIR